MSCCVSLGSEKTFLKCGSPSVVVRMTHTCADIYLQAATAMSLVRMILVVCLQETKDPTLDFVRLSLFG